LDVLNGKKAFSLIARGFLISYLQKENLWFKISLLDTFKTNINIAKPASRERVSSNIPIKSSGLATFLEANK
jgi:hypothetical protein